MIRCSTLALLVALSPVAWAGSSEVETAAEVDRLLLKHLADEAATPAPPVNDEDFLRRVSLDLAGVLPSPAEVTAFGLNPRPDKRAQVIDKLLNSPKYAELWASYWTDVVYLRATDQRARIGQPAFEKWLQDQLAANRPWNEITREMITATGSVREEGRTGLIFAHTGQAEEVAAEIARIFMGIQLSCANCHNHPTDSWKREQFHQLAAFLPRITVRPENPGDIRTFTVKSLEQTPGGGREQNIDPEQIIRFLDRNRDGKISKEEARGPLQQRFDENLKLFDKDKDGLLSKEEFADARMLMMDQPGRGSSEHFMPDLKNPSSKGTAMQPVFFISGVKGPKLKPGADDQTRRNALADYVTSPTNPWFAEAFVNRIWAELLGRGFYMPIDDMGPERRAVDEDVLLVLARGFVNSGHDIKWLFRTITNTQAYQRQMAATSAAPFAAAAPARLRSDQIYNSIFEVLGVDQSPPIGGGRREMQGAMMMRAYGLNPQKFAFSTLFGFDPSTPQEDLLGNVPQALFLMNSPQLDSQIRGAGLTRLSGILHKNPDNRDALDELYLLVLTRTPTQKETEINLAYLEEVGRREEAFEDIMWSLLNSTEFLSRR